MSKPEWTKIGSGPVEYCVGTDGVTGVWNGTYVSAIHPGATSPDWITTKELFEVRHCQPQKPRHIRTDYADGSVVVDSTEKDEQGRPLRCAFVSRSYGDLAWTERGDATGRGHTTEEAIRDAIRYVETGE